MTTSNSIKVKARGDSRKLRTDNNWLVFINFAPNRAGMTDHPGLATASLATCAKGGENRTIIFCSGGHALAAGLTIQPDELDAFHVRLNNLGRRTLKQEDLQPPLRLDAEVKLGELSLDSLVALDQLRPMGQRNPADQLPVGAQVPLVH